MGSFDSLKSAAGNMVQGAQALVEGAGQAAVDTFKGTVKSLKVEAETVVKAGSTLVAGANQAQHDAAAAVRRHDLLGGAAQVHQDLAAGAGRAMVQAWDGTAKAVGASAGGVHDAMADAGAAVGRAYHHTAAAAVGVTGAVAGHKAAEMVGQGAKAIGAVTGAVAEGSLAAGTAFSKNVGGLVKGTGDLAIAADRVLIDGQYRDQAVAKFKEGALAIGDKELAAMRDPAAAKAALVKSVHGKIEAFNQAGLKAMREGHEPDFVGGVIGNAAAIILTTAAPESKVAAGAEAAGRLAQGATDVERGVDAAEEVGGNAAKAAAETKDAGEAVAPKQPATAGAGSKPPVEPPTKPTGQPAPEPEEGPHSIVIRSIESRGPDYVAARTRFLQKVYVGEGVSAQQVTDAIDRFSNAAGANGAKFLDKVPGRLVIENTPSGLFSMTLVSGDELPTGVVPYAESPLAKAAPEAAGQAEGVKRERPIAQEQPRGRGRPSKIDAAQKAADAAAAKQPQGGAGGPEPTPPGGAEAAPRAQSPRDAAIEAATQTHQIHVSFWKNVRIADGVSVEDAEKAMQTLFAGKSRAEVTEIMKAHEGENMIVHQPRGREVIAQFGDMSVPQPRFKSLDQLDEGHARAAHMARLASLLPE